MIGRDQVLVRATAAYLDERKRGIKTRRQRSVLVFAFRNVERVGLRIEARLTPELLSYWREDLVPQSEVHRQLRRNLPIILAEERPSPFFGRNEVVCGYRAIVNYAQQHAPDFVSGVVVDAAIGVGEGRLVPVEVHVPVRARH